MLRDVWTKTLWDYRRALLGWAIGFFAVSLMYGGFYPSVNTPAFADAMDSYPEGLMEAFGWEDITSAAGYLGSTVFGILGSVLIVIFAAAFGARAIAGDEESGSLELLVVHPVSRGGVVTQRAVSVAIAMGTAGLVVFLATMILNGPAELDLPIGNLIAASVQLALLGFVFGALGMLVGALTGRRGLTLAVTAVVAVISYLGNTAAPQIDQLAWLERVSPFFYAFGSEPLRNGFDVGSTLVLLITGLVLVFASVIAFNRRDIGT